MKKSTILKYKRKQESILSLALLGALLIVLISGIVVIDKSSQSQTIISDQTINSIKLSPEDDSGQLVKQQLGFDPTNPGATAEDLRNKYLAKEWSTIIASKPVIGPIHTFFLSHPLIFKIIFNSPYSYTPTFLLIVLLWFYFGFLAKDVMSFTAYNKNIGLIVGFIFPIFLAQLGLLNIISTFFVDLVISKDKWWVRWTISLLIAGAMFVSYKIEGKVAKYIQSIRKAEKELEKNAKIERADKFRQGFENGAGI